MRKSFVFEMTLCSVMAALAIILDRIGSINIGYGLKLTLYGLPLMIVGIVFGIKCGFLTGLVAGIVMQLLSPYGLTLTSVFWALAPVAWGGVSGVLYLLFKKYNKWVAISLVVFITSLIANLINTFAMFLDSLLIKDSYYTLSLIITQWPGRLLAALIAMIPHILLLVLITTRLKELIVVES